MFREIERQAKPTSLQQTLVQAELDKAAARIRIIDDYRALIAESETLAERLVANGLDYGVKAVPNVLLNGVIARVIVVGQPISAIRSAITRAGLHIASERSNNFFGTSNGEPEFTRVLRIELAGLDCPILASGIPPELAEAA